MKLSRAILSNALPRRSFGSARAAISRPIRILKRSNFGGDAGLGRGSGGSGRWVSTSAMVMSDDGVQKARNETEVSSDLSEKHYHLIADDTFDALMDEFLGEVEDSDDLDDVDINFSQGVMAIKLGPPHGTWVINKQTPNRQIWWSSPISGPMRYELPDDVDVQEAIDEQDPVALVSRWKNTKDGSDLLHRLRDELKSVINIDIISGHK